MSQPMDKTQRRIMMLLPLVFITVIAHFKVGLLIYWVTTNLWTVGQGLVTRRLVPKTAPAPEHGPEALVADTGGGCGERRLGERREGRATPKPAPPKGPDAAAAGEAEQGHRQEVSSERTVEATGETVSEAKWRALRELELAVPGLDKAAVRFQVLSEGERGLLGVGYTPARVARGGRRFGRGRASGRGAADRRERSGGLAARPARPRHRRDRRSLPDRGRGVRRRPRGDVLSATTSGF